MMTGYAKHRMTRSERFLKRLRTHLTDPGLVANKISAVALIALTLPIMSMEHDATATVAVALIAVPMFFSDKPWIY